MGSQRKCSNKNYVQASITRSAAKVKKEKSENYEGPSRRFQYLRFTHYPYSSTMPLTPMPWNSSSGMIGNPQWAYFNHVCNIISYIMKGYYQVTIHLISYKFVADPKGRNT